MTKKLLIDVDCGVDDAQAIMMALAAPNVEVLGITCVHGNTTVENVCRNTLRVLKACHKLEIPVFKGADKPILGKCIEAEHFHGMDGLGDVPDLNVPGLDMIQEEGGVSAMIRLVNENPGQITLVATAPLTNLALAVKLDPSFPTKLKGFNFAADPEAAYIVLNEYHCPTTIACWEFTCRSKLSWTFCAAWLGQKTEKAHFMENIFRFSMGKSVGERMQKEFVAGTGLVSCDSYAMAAAIDDGIVLESDCYPVSVELTGTHTRGMMVIDTTDKLNKTHKVQVIKKMDLDKFMEMMMMALQ
ncbi:Inosine-uridine preferring nucleoside hydrolase [Merluccius polli]|uniref:Inosine-uridine preferring nucleoside hydrolase n=1 Tax=Merluccius polli TaxID=89951 RepID=A0AA47ML08_MERPO|nr:Inosine-uridine preferring nucleoside hydrolase [Merluccius polli]